MRSWAGDCTSLMLSPLPLMFTGKLPALVGVPVTVQLMLSPDTRLATGDAGVQLTWAQAGKPLMLQAALVTGVLPLLVQLKEPLYG